jgi:Beta-galactosidase jelly roll domain
MNYKNSYIKSSSFWISLSGIPVLIMLSLFVLSLNACHINHNDNNDNNEFKTEINLKGSWKFSIGDDMKWNKPDFNDNNWENIKVPSPWENEGFNGYDGYAWYRKHFNVPLSLKGKSVYLSMGYIDDCDQTYINGHLVGFAGSFPPNYYTAYNAKRMYPCPQEFINFNGDNVIAVRVYDDQLEGGITSGDIAVKSIESLQTDLNLEGLWKFSLGDSVAYKYKDFKDANWEKLIVPAWWEVQGHPDYDGFAWYRKSFILPDNLKNKDLMFLGGKIDDLDQVFLNGVLIGSTGDMGKNLGNGLVTSPVVDQEWSKFRAYNIPDSLIIPGKPNTLAVRVYDGGLNGGMYQGPVGIVTSDKFTKFWREHKNR